MKAIEDLGNVTFDKLAAMGALSSLMGLIGGLDKFGDSKACADWYKGVKTDFQNAKALTQPGGGNCMDIAGGWNYHQCLNDVTGNTPSGIVAWGQLKNLAQKLAKECQKVQTCAEQKK